MYLTETLFSLTDLTVRRSTNFVLESVTVAINRGECWAITGPIGSGKTTLLEILAGKLAVTAQQMPQRVAAAMVSFREESHQFSYTRHFYQQRYQSTLSDVQDGQPVLTLRRYLEPVWSILSNSAEADALIERMGIGPLLDVEFLKLSNGQTRKARIAKALLQHPTMLLLDNPYIGLDARFRHELTNWLGELFQAGQPLAIAVDPTAIPDFVTHVLALNKGHVVYSGPVAGYEPVLFTSVSKLLPVLQTPPQTVDFSEAFRLTDVTVRYGDKKLLDAVSWVVKAGERWALLGHNGAGKSILLSILYGDHPQAYANQVYVFGHRRGRPGTSIWDIKRRIGFVSPELHLYFPRQLTARQVALTGLTDTLVVPVKVAANVRYDLDALMTYFGIDHLADRLFGTLSTGEQRLTLFIRAVLKNPAMLILDEPFQALDSHHVELARRLLDAQPPKTIVFVTHDPNELPDSVNHRIDICAGKIAFSIE